jgi:pyruvate dehydrogenase E1 component
VDHKGAPTVILAKTVKGYGLGEAGEGKNITHQQKKLNEDELREFRTRFRTSRSPTRRWPTRRSTGRPTTARRCSTCKERARGAGRLSAPRVNTARRSRRPATTNLSQEFYEGTDGRELHDHGLRAHSGQAAARQGSASCGAHRARRSAHLRHGGLFRQVGIYSPRPALRAGRRRQPALLQGATDGQILEEGITEAGSMASFIAAGTAYATHGVNTIPFFIYYSMFGFQRIGDLIWAAATCRARGFLLGATAGRTTLAGEGLQHQDGHSHVLALPPNRSRPTTRPSPTSWR